MRLAAALLLVGLVAAGCSDVEQRAEEPPANASPTASGADAVQRFDGLSADHVEGRVEYDRTPPVGGPHLARWLACGVYDAPVPDEAAVHSMEHGAVWITHRPDLPRADVEQLRELVRLDPEYVLVSPYEGLPAPVVASGWGLQLTAEAADDERLRTFVETYAGGDQGGEPGAPCRTGGLTADQAREAVG